LKLIHPAFSEVISRVIVDTGGRYVLSYGLVVPFALHPDGPTIPADRSPVWPWAIAAMGDNCLLDEAWPKVRGEYLAYGAAYSKWSSEQPVTARIVIGSLAKQLLVFGDRHRSALGIRQKPELFSRMPITAQNAFGGNSYALNPLGKGLDALSIAGTQYTEIPMPNIESPANLISSDNDRPEPSGFWSYPPEWPQRTTYLGEFDDTWFQSRWPHLPIDTDRRFFQTAPADQQLPGFFEGNEQIEIENMHSQLPVIQSALPGTRARVFVRDLSDSGQPPFKEFKANAETVWLFPDSLAGLILYRAVIPLTSDDTDTLAFVYSDLESLEQAPASVETHHENFLKKLGSQ
jgi:hypothetical protein